MQPAREGPNSRTAAGAEWGRPDRLHAARGANVRSAGPARPAPAAGRGGSGGACECARARACERVCPRMRAHECACACMHALACASLRGFAIMLVPAFRCLSVRCADRTRDCARARACVRADPSGIRCGARAAPRRAAMPSISRWARRPPTADAVCGARERAGAFCRGADRREAARHAYLGEVQQKAEQVHRHYR